MGVGRPVWPPLKAVIKRSGVPPREVVRGTNGAVTEARPLRRHGCDLIGLSLAIFDVLRIDGMDAMCLPYAERRA